MKKIAYNIVEGYNNTFKELRKFSLQQISYTEIVKGVTMVVFTDEDYVIGYVASSDLMVKVPRDEYTKKVLITRVLNNL